MKWELLEGPNGAYYVRLADGRLLTPATFSATGLDRPDLLYFVRVGR